MIIKGRVVRIFDDEKVAINLGREHGIARGKTIWFRAPPTEIEDPETEELLGSYSYLKATGKVIAVAEKFAIVGALPREEQTIPLGAQFGGLGGWNTPTVTKRLPGHLPVRDLQADPIPGGSDIGIGDSVEAEVDEEAKSRSAEPANGAGQSN